MNVCIPKKIKLKGMYIYAQAVVYTREILN